MAEGENGGFNKIRSVKIEENEVISDQEWKAK